MWDAAPASGSKRASATLPPSSTTSSRVMSSPEMARGLPASPVAMAMAGTTQRKRTEIRVASSGPVGTSVTSTMASVV